MGSCRLQPTSLPHPWDSPGKNSGVGCHFLLQCLKVKSESEVAQSCPTLRDPMDYSLPGSSVHGIFQARVLEWGAITFSERLLPQNKIKFYFAKIVWRNPIISIDAEKVLTTCNILSKGFPGGLEIKKPALIQETWVRSLGQEDPLEKEMQLTPVFCLGNPVVREAWLATVHGVTKETDITEQLNNNNNPGPIVSKKHRVEESEIPGP